jgi:hypothetical protein
MLLREYFAHIRDAVDKFDRYGFAESVDIREETRAAKQGIVKIEVVLVDGSALSIKEYIDAKYKIVKVSCAYQYQNRDGGLIFRYDNAAHKPAFGFKEHKHTSSGEVIKAELPDIVDLVDEVIGYLQTI